MPALTQNFEQLVGILMPDFMSGAGVADDALLKQFPFRFVDSDKVLYDQYENAFGLIPLRGLGSKPDVFTFNGWKRYVSDPAYFGVTSLVEEGEITKGVQPGTVGDRIDINDRLALIARNTAQLIRDRARQFAADLVRTGKIDLTDTAGRRFQYALENYAGQIKVPGVTWSNVSATPIVDMLNFKAQLQKGTDSRFGKGSRLLANSNTIAEFFNITEIKSTYRTDYGATVNGLAKVNADLQQGFDLPTIEVYDDGYYPTAADAINKTNWAYFIPNRCFLWFGERPAGQPISQWQLTRHAGIAETSGAGAYPELPTPAGGNPDFGKGVYVRAHYQNRMPHQYEIEAGINGLPVVFYPSAVAAITYS